jgi:hypothetical protein
MERLTEPCLSATPKHADGENREAQGEKRDAAPRGRDLLVDQQCKARNLTTLSGRVPHKPQEA